jgi:hypothetical protein
MLATKEIKMVECPKCAGSGYIPQYAGIANGVCFTCSGSGKIVYRVKKIDKFSPINAMHCKTVSEAQSFRLAEFTSRFPELKLTPEAENSIKNGCSQLMFIVESLS